MPRLVARTKPRSCRGVKPLLQFPNRAKLTFPFPFETASDVPTFFACRPEKRRNTPA